MYCDFFCFSSFLFAGELSVSTLHTEPPMSEMPLCNWVGHHYTLVWCAGFHSVLWVRWENWGVLWRVISRVSSEGCFESWDEKETTDATRVFHCINMEVQWKNEWRKGLNSTISVLGGEKRTNSGSCLCNKKWTQNNKDFQKQNKSCSTSWTKG